MGSAGRPVHPGLRGRGGDPGPADGQDADHPADADRVGLDRGGSWISIDMSTGYEKRDPAVAEQDERFRPEVVFDTFHVCHARQPRRRGRRPRRHERARPEQDQQRKVDQPRPLVAAQSPRAPEQAQLARLGEVATTNKRLDVRSSQGRTQAALPPPRPGQGHRAPRRLARLGVTIQAQTIRQARPHHPQIPRRDPRHGAAR